MGGSHDSGGKIELLTLLGFCHVPAPQCRRAPGSWPLGVVETVQREWNHNLVLYHMKDTVEQC
jgi:hypothetical protein